MSKPSLAIVTSLVLICGLVFAAWPAQASITDVTATPDRIAISATAPSTVTVVWRVTRLAPTPGAAGTVSSPSGTLTINGVPVGTAGGTLSRSLPGPTPVVPQTVTFTETIFIPQGLAFRSVKSSAPIIYTRTFTDSSDAGSDSGSATLNPSGPGSEPFSVSRLSLEFDDQSRVRVLSRGSRLRAIAELNTTGVGLIIGTWEIAIASTTAGTPIFRPLSLVRRNIAGGRRVFITSPPLPTTFEGANLVRLSITEPATFFDEPILQYYVTPESALPDQQEPRLLIVTAPRGGTPLTLTTRFAWQPVKGAEAYKLEVFSGDLGPSERTQPDDYVAAVPIDPLPSDQAEPVDSPLTGIILPGTVTETRLKDFSLAHLAPQKRYFWTVRAIGKDGVILAVSPRREIYKP